MNESRSRNHGGKLISAVITCYYEEKTIDEFYSRLSGALKSLDVPYEMIFVNDGSKDGTYDRLKAIFDSDPCVAAVIDLFKNSGQAAAITAGMQSARGDVFLFMDSDLQLDPEELPVLIAEYEKGFDLVTGYRKERKDSLFRIIPSKIANVIMRKVSDSNIRDFGCTFKLFNSGLIRAFEFGPFKILQIPQVIARTNRISEVPVTHHPRKMGKSGWTFRKLFAYNMDNIVNISERLFQLLGAVCIFIAMLVFVRLALMYVAPIKILDVITNGLVLNVILFTFLIIVAILAAIGEFAIRSFSILSRFPAYIIREEHLRESD